MPWLRLWVDIQDDPDMSALPDDVFGGWCKLLIVAKRNTPQGQLLPVRKLAHVLHRSEAAITRWINELMAAGLIEEDGGFLVMHNWQRWQEKDDKTNTARQARHREKLRNGPPNNPPEERDTEREGEVTESNAVTSPLQPSPAVTSRPSEIDAVCDWAMEVAGDVAWGPWVLRQAKVGHSPEAIKTAIAAALDSNKLSMPYVAAVLKRYATEGVPELKTASKAVKAALRPSWGAITPKEAS